jgi:putative acetyltransferase
VTETITPITVRAARPDDLRVVHDLHVRAFGGRRDEAVLVDLLHSAGKAAPSLVAIVYDEVVGHVVFSPMQIDPPRPGLRVLAMGPVAVLPEWQRRGVGSKMVRAGLDACRDAGVDAVAVLGGPRFYGRFGFRPAMHRGLTNEYVQDEHFMVLELRSGALTEVTGLLKYAPEFKDAGC